MSQSDQSRFGFFMPLFVLMLIVGAYFVGKSDPETLTTWWEEVVEGDGSRQEHQADPTDDDESDQDEQDEEAPLAQPLTVRIAEDVLSYAGIKKTTLTKIDWAIETETFATVVDAQELVKWHTRLTQKQSNIDVAAVAAKTAKNEYDRLVKVQGAVAKKNIAYAQADWSNKQAQLSATQQAYRNDLIELRQQWGDVITEWVTTSNSLFDTILTRKKALIEVLVDNTQVEPTVFVSTLAGRWTAKPTQYVSPAFVKSPVANKHSVYYLTSADNLVPGQKLYAWLKQDDDVKKGFFIPEQAIIWYAGEPWAYVEKEEGLYKRYSIRSGIERDNGIFTEVGFNENDQLIVSGSQMLLSEEFRWQIHDEDDDDGDD